MFFLITHAICRCEAGLVCIENITLARGDMYFIFECSIEENSGSVYKADVTQDDFNDNF